jgi:hypothetical protein
MHKIQCDLVVKKDEQIYFVTNNPRCNIFIPVATNDVQRAYDNNINNEIKHIFE